MTHPYRIVTVALLGSVVALLGCKTASPDYARPLAAGQSALQKLDPAQWPDLRAPYQSRDAQLIEALDRSLQWFDKPSTQRFYPLDGITHEQARASVYALRQLLSQSASAAEFRYRATQEFDVYRSVGWNGEGHVLFTGYYSPEFRASPVRTAQFNYPLYKRPADLVSDPHTGQTLGRQTPGGIVTYPARAEIESTQMLAGQELVWLPSRLDAYLIQVNGSAKLIMPDQSILYIGYAGNNGHEYTSIGQLLLKEGKLDRNRLSLGAIRDYFHAHPQEVDRTIQRNDRFVFFQEYDGGNWPAGSLGVKVTPWRSVATDKTIFPRGCPTMVQTHVPRAGSGWRPLWQFMVDQDTGGAIRAAGRADLYMGVGPEAEQTAGRQTAEGYLYYLIVKPDRLDAWRSAQPAI